MQSTPLLASFLNPLWPGMVAPYRILSKDQIKLNCIFLNRTVYMYTNRFGIDNLQWLICQKTKPMTMLDQGYNCFII